MAKRRRLAELGRADREAARMEGTVAARFSKVSRSLGTPALEREIEAAIKSGNVARAMRALPVVEVREAYEPVAEALRETFAKGGRLAAREIHNA